MEQSSPLHPSQQTRPQILVTKPGTSLQATVSRTLYPEGQSYRTVPLATLQVEVTLLKKHARTPCVSARLTLLATLHNAPLYPALQKHSPGLLQPPFTHPTAQIATIIPKDMKMFYLKHTKHTSSTSKSRGCPTCCT